MVRVEELPAICMYTSFLYQISCVNQEPTCLVHCKNSYGQPVNLEDLPGASESFNRFRGNMPEQLKLYFDQLDYFDGMNQIFKGLRRFTQVCQIVGIIKPLEFGDERLVYEQRFKAFEALSIPQYIPHGAYRETLDRENEI